MSLEIHNYIWSGKRLVQIETQSHHIDGILDVIQNVRKSSNLDWEDIYSANYKCEEDSTTTFYEGESAEAGNPGVWTYVVYDCNEAEEEVIRNLSVDVLATLFKVKQKIEDRKTSKLNTIPNAENAVVDIRKLLDYCLNTEHSTGKHKARLFSSILGISADDAEELRQILLEVVKTYEVQLGRCDEFGQRYTLDFSLEWKGRIALIRSGWIIENESNIPKLTTCYPL
ncbi:DUF6883 domain-containing protein [Nostoc sp. PCC 7107]|uniref:DUF6883 domain-containing protein n=1 Tax=Nostoc sp. PCC 7107 TaxID=317936 RepID=UPI00029F0047|nr:DUF6883 domain-containing protein [Nostoc sp. PCC 7107]AFY41355.1 hypothetical protein Nos7107_0685 [Nostoc sp. PCC 7107]